MNNNQLNTESDDLLGKTALVTGAAQGMGRAISLRLARCGANLVINDLEVDNLASTMKELCQMEAAAVFRHEYIDVRRCPGRSRRCD